MGTVKNMAEVGIRALKQNASAVVSEAAGGETVTITDRGRPVAQTTAIPVSRLVLWSMPEGLDEFAARWWIFPRRNEVGMYPPCRPRCATRRVAEGGVHGRGSQHGHRGLQVPVGRRADVLR